MDYTNRFEDEMQDEYLWEEQILTLKIEPVNHMITKQVGKSSATVYMKRGLITDCGVVSFALN